MPKEFILIKKDVLNGDFHPATHFVLFMNKWFFRNGGVFEEESTVRNKIKSISYDCLNKHIIKESNDYYIDIEVIIGMLGGTKESFIEEFEFVKKYNKTIIR